MNRMLGRRGPSEVSVDAMRDLHLADKDDHGLDVGIREPFYRRHVSIGPVMGPDAVSDGVHEGKVGVVAAMASVSNRR